MVGLLEPGLYDELLHEENRVASIIYYNARIAAFSKCFIRNKRIGARNVIDEKCKKRKGKKAG